MDRSMGSMETSGGASVRLPGDGTGLSLGGADTLRPEGAALGRIDQYELLRELGGGGFGVVYLARDTVAGVDVAVKGLPPLVKNNAEELERIRENFALVSKLHHPHIAAALHLHQAKEARYADERVRQALRVMPGDYLMVMAYAPGVTLNKWRKQFPDGRVPAAQALEVCRQIAEALDYAHGEKVAHRDVKPSNVMVETRGESSKVLKCGSSKVEGTQNVEVVVRVLDFGLAAEIRSSMSRVSQEKGDTSGTRPYMAPEQWAGRKQDGRTDQYALAALFYELVSGAVPFASAFETGDPVIMANAAENKQPEPLPELSKAQNAALLRGLAKEPAARFASCGEFIAALGGRASPRAAGERDRRSEVGGRKALWLVGAAALVAVTLAYGSYRAYMSYTARRTAAEQSAALNAAQREKLVGLRSQAEAALAGVKPDVQDLAMEKVAEPALPVPEGEVSAVVASVERVEDIASKHAADAVDKEPEPVSAGAAEPQAEPHGATSQTVAEAKAQSAAADGSGMNRALDIRLAVEGGDRVYRGGEKVVFTVQANQDCHLGLVCHQQDGSVVVLFPNPYHPDSRVKAGERTRIPGAVDPAFEIVIGPPYGQDLVEAVACVAKSDLHALLEKAAGGSRQGYGVLERGMFVESVGKLEKTTSPDGKQQNMARVAILLRTQE